MLVRVAVGEVEEAACEQQRRAVGCDVAEPHGDERERLVGRQLEHRGGAAEQLEALVSGSESRQSVRPSSSRWSGGSSAVEPYGHQLPASAPCA